MRSLRELEKHRQKDARVLALYGSYGDETCGVFNIPHPKTGVILHVLASSGEGWEHVSVSLPHRCPNWHEMERVKRAFFKDDECVMQLHVPVTDHISVHDNCLHLWRPIDAEIPRPPSWMVG